LAEETAEETSWQEQSWQEQSLQEATKKPVKLGAAVKHKSGTLEPEKLELGKLGVAAVERMAAKQVEQETKATELAVAV
jgi:hypothetical protein